MQEYYNQYPDCRVMSTKIRHLLMALKLKMKEMYKYNKIESKSINVWNVKTPDRYHY